MDFKFSDIIRDEEKLDITEESLSIEEHKQYVREMLTGLCKEKCVIEVQMKKDARAIEIRGFVELFEKMFQYMLTPAEITVRDNTVIVDVDFENIMCLHALLAGLKRNLKYYNDMNFLVEYENIIIKNTMNKMVLSNVIE